MNGLKCTAIYKLQGSRVAEYVCSGGMTQAEAAKTLGVTQPRISDQMRGKVDVFSIDTLVNMLAAAEIRLEMRLKKAA